MEMWEKGTDPVTDADVPQAELTQGGLMSEQDV
jgi:hypothetical protein